MFIALNEIIYPSYLSRTIFIVKHLIYRRWLNFNTESVPSDFTKKNDLITSQKICARGFFINILIIHLFIRIYMTSLNGIFFHVERN